MTAIESEIECMERRKESERIRLLRDAVRRLREDLDSNVFGTKTPYDSVFDRNDDVRLLVEFIEPHFRKEAV